MGGTETQLHCCLQLLLEWGADIQVKNRLSKTALELTRNTDLKAFLSSEALPHSAHAFLLLDNFMYGMNVLNVWGKAMF